MDPAEIFATGALNGGSRRGEASLEPPSKEEMRLTVFTNLSGHHSDLC